MAAITAKQSSMADDDFKKEKVTQKLDEIEIPSDILPAEKTPITEYNVLFKLVKKRRGRFYLDNCCDNVPNPNNKNTPERIWLLNGVRSIWDSELEYILKDKARYERARRGRDIIFQEGVCRVRSTDVLMLEFLRNNTHNVGDSRTGSGKFDFYEYNPKKEQEDRHKKQLIKIEMITKAKEMPIEKVKKLVSFFGISFVDELGMPISEDGLRTELMLYADNNPAQFQKHIDSREVEVAYLVKRAIIEAKIDLQGGNGNALWSQGKGFIAKVPSTRKPYEYLTELALTNSNEGRAFREQLEQIVT